MRYGYCIFCDDIRTEVGEKLSFIGTYNGVMIVSGRFPITLPKFCAHVTLVTPASQPYKSLVLKCYAPGKTMPLLEEHLDTPRPEEQEAIAADVTNPEAPPASIVIAATLMFSPLKISQPGLFCVRAVIDGGPGEVNVAALRVTEK